MTKEELRQVERNLTKNINLLTAKLRDVLCQLLLLETGSRERKEK